MKTRLGLRAVVLAGVLAPVSLPMPRAWGAPEDNTGKTMPPEVVAAITETFRSAIESDRYQKLLVMGATQFKMNRINRAGEWAFITGVYRWPPEKRNVPPRVRWAHGVLRYVKSEVGMVKIPGREEYQLGPVNEKPFWSPSWYVVGGRFRTNNRYEYQILTTRERPNPKDPGGKPIREERDEIPAVKAMLREKGVKSVVIQSLFTDRWLQGVAAGRYSKASSPSAASAPPTSATGARSCADSFMRAILSGSGEKAKSALAPGAQVDFDLSLIGQGDAPMISYKILAQRRLNPSEYEYTVAQSYRDAETGESFTHRHQVGVRSVSGNWRVSRYQRLPGR